MLKSLTEVRKTAILLFVGLSACYLSLSPGSIAGQGYVDEEMQSGLRMLAVVNAWLKGRPIPPMLWSRHGPVPVLFDLPFLKLGKMFVSSDFMLSFQPVLLTAVLLTILYLWLRRLCSPAMSLLLTLTGAFGTMLWPYAYSSLETKQSFFVLLAGSLALSEGKIRGWPRLFFFAAIWGEFLDVVGIEPGLSGGHQDAVVCIKRSPKHGLESTKCFVLRAHNHPSNQLADIPGQSRPSGT
jgi:hypothetical protein